jgi:aspartate kinase
MISFTTSIKHLTEREPRVRERPLVIKFGGTSVGGGAQFVRAAKIAAEAAQSRPMAVVVSAMSGTTDILLGYADITTGTTNRTTSTGATHEGSVAELHRTLSERHLRAASEAVSGEHLPGVEGRLQVLLEQLIEAINAPAENAAARRAAIAVYGERLSAEILAGAISSAGPPASVVERDPIATDARFDEAEVDAAGTRARCSRHVGPLLDEGVVAVVPGYVGRSPEGLPTTLGRGGSDLSATVIGRALGSEEVWIMSDVDGVLDADPRLVPDATLMPHLSYRVAGLFAALGAKVLHPKTMEPASEAGIEVRVRNTFNLECSGTRVTEREDGEGIRCVALRRRFAVELPCASRRHQKKAAAVIGIGSPERGDLKRGLKGLQEVGISPLHAGPTTAGLVFIVVPEAAEEALRALHSRLITPAAEVVA